MAGHCLHGMEHLVIAVVNGAAKACIVPVQHNGTDETISHIRHANLPQIHGGQHKPEIAAVCLPSIPKLVIWYERICASRKKASCAIEASESDRTDNGRLTRVLIC